MNNLNLKRLSYKCYCVKYDSNPYLLSLYCKNYLQENPPDCMPFSSRKELNSL